MAKGSAFLVEAVTERFVGRPTVRRITFVAQIPADLDSELDQRRLTLLTLQLMGERHMYRLGEARLLQRRKLASQGIGLGIVDVEGDSGSFCTISSILLYALR